MLTENVAIKIAYRDHLYHSHDIQPNKMHKIWQIKYTVF